MKPKEPDADQQRWMSHYWEASVTDKGQRPTLLTVEVLQARVAELADEIKRRREAGLQCNWLVEEQAWRERQIDLRRSQT